MTNGRSWSLAGVYAATAAIVITAGLGIVGAAGADEAANADVYVTEASGPCFTTVAAKPQCDVGEVANVTINTGETVTWHFDGSATFHNAESSNAVPADPAWEGYSGTFVTGGSYSRPFNQPGSYEFVCGAHPTTMRGTITVTGNPIPTQTATGTATATATPSPPSSPPPSGHVETPPPSSGTDTVKPSLGSVRLTAMRGAVRVRFRLSEPATVTVRVKRRGSRKVLKSARVQARAGTRTVTLRSKQLKAGRYTVEIQARDAFGNRSSLARKRLTLRG
jgi:plastocyanin